MKVYCVIGGIDYEGQTASSLELFESLSEAEKYKEHLQNEGNYDYSLILIRELKSQFTPV